MSKFSTNPADVLMSIEEQPKEPEKNPRETAPLNPERTPRKRQANTRRTPEEPPTLASRRAETKSRSVHLLMKPSLYEWAKETATAEGISFNDYMSYLIEKERG